MSKFSDRLRDLRSAYNITMKELGIALNIPKSRIANWEVGRCIPNVTDLRALADYFNTTIDYLLCRTDIKNSIKDIVSDDFVINIGKLTESLSEDEKNILLKIAKSFTNSNKE